MHNQIIDYYNDFAAYQKRTGKNRRHKKIILDLYQLGLKPYHNVLEIGCGIGTISSHLAKYLKKGQIVGVDISNKSIEFATNKYSHLKNLKFICSSITELNLQGQKFDYIILPDVLEHIPIEQHQNVISVLKNLITNNGIVYVNIPAANYIRYLEKNLPEKLQIIDQPIELDLLINNFKSQNFRLLQCVTYSLFTMQHDACTLVFTISKDIQPMHEIKGLNKKLKEIYSLIKFFFADWYYKLKNL